MEEDFFSTPPTYGSLLKKMRELKTQFPFLQLYPIGRSLLGRQLYAAALGAASPCVLFAGAFHAQEWLTASLLLLFLERTCRAIQTGGEIAGAVLGDCFAARGLVVVPMANPDGVSIALEGAESAGSLASAVRKMQKKSTASWQANARGVDLNHNYDAGWQKLRQIEREHGILGPGARQFGGAFPHSEPETQAMAAFFKGRTVDTAYAFHSQGEEIYSEYGEHTPLRSRYLARLLAETSGYRLIQNGGLCSHGGFKDYFIDRYHRPGFTLEIGKGENPLPIGELAGVYEQLEGTLVAAAVL